VRADESRHVMAMQLSHYDAVFLTDALLKAKIFHAVLVETDEPRAAREREQCNRHLGHSKGA
jgi:hypothetical protein